MMFKPKYIAVTGTLLMSIFSWAGTAHASHALPGDKTVKFTTSYVQTVQNYQSAQSRTVRISTAKAKSIARNHVRGAKEVLDVTLSGDVYIVRVEKQGGRIVDVMVDAATGRVR